MLILKSIVLFLAIFTTILLHVRANLKIVDREDVLVPSILWTIFYFLHFLC